MCQNEGEKKGLLKGSCGAIAVSEILLGGGIRCADRAKKSRRVLSNARFMRAAAKLTDCCEAAALIQKREIVMIAEC